MRSKSNGVENRAKGVLGVPQADHVISQEPEKLKAKVQPTAVEDQVQVAVISDGEKERMDSPDDGVKEEDLMDLPKKDLLKLLGIMEGEVQVGCGSSLKCVVFMIFDLSKAVEQCKNLHFKTLEDYIKTIPHVVDQGESKPCPIAPPSGLKWNLTKMCFLFSSDTL